MKKILFILILLLSFTNLFSQDFDTTLVEDKPTEDVFQSVQKMPTFPGGVLKMNEFINKNILKNSAQGFVYVHFIITDKGLIQNVIVDKGLNELSNKEAIRIVKLMPNWIPGEQNGKKVNVCYYLKIKF